MMELFAKIATSFSFLLFLKEGHYALNLGSILSLPWQRVTGDSCFYLQLHSPPCIREQVLQEHPSL